MGNLFFFLEGSARTSRIAVALLLCVWVRLKCYSAVAMIKC